MNISQKVFKQYREELGITQEQYGGMWGMSQSLVSLIEKGEKDYKSDIFSKILKKRGQLISDPNK